MIDSNRYLSGARRVFFGLLTATAALLAAPRDAHAVYKFCATIAPSYVDSNVGEDNLRGTITAGRHWMEVKLNGTLVGKGYADDQGCLNMTFSAAGAYTHGVFPQLSWNTAGSPETVARVRRKPGDALTGTILNWGSLPASTGSSVVDKRSTLTGTTLDAIWRVTAVLLKTPFRVTGKVYDIYAEVPVATAPCVGCVAGEEMWLSAAAGTWLNQMKAVIGHEWGHFLQSGLFGQFGQQDLTTSNKYCDSVGTNEATCRCDKVDASAGSGICGNEQWDRLHCLNSREYMFAAFAEGWAHLIASHMLNNTSETSAVFPYYKKQIHANGVDVIPTPVPHSVIPTTRPRWMETECASSMAGRGTEMDWLGFLYYLTTQTTNKYSFAEFQTLMANSAVCNGFCTDSDKMTYSKLVLGVDNQSSWSSAKKNHFKTNGSAFGVSH